MERLLTDEKYLNQEIHKAELELLIKSVLEDNNYENSPFKNKISV